MSSDLNKLFCSAKVIDTHAHVVLKETEGAAGEYGPDFNFLYLGDTIDSQSYPRVLSIF